MIRRLLILSRLIARIVYRHQSFANYNNIFRIDCELVVVFSVYLGNNAFEFDDVINFQIKILLVDFNYETVVAISRNASIPTRCIFGIVLPNKHLNTRANHKARC